MDCFSKLPAELRIRIFSQFSSTTTIFRLIQASPIMLFQYRASKTTIRRHYVVNLLNGDRYEQLLQDALCLLYLELADNRPDNHVMRYIIMQWSSKALPNPFEKKDQATIDDLYKLFSHMSMFVEDFISKATSSNPPQAYLCLPQIEIPSRGLYYNQHSFCPEHVTLDELTSSECQLLAWAFIRYDMLCKIDGHKAALLLDDGEYSAITKKVLYELSNYEQEAICCVFEYIKAVHGALYTVSTRCSTRHASSALRDNSADPVRLLYPDNLYFNPIAARKDMKLPQQCIPALLGYVYDLSDLGFDLLRNLVLFANKTQPEDMRSWLYTILSDWRRSQHPSPRNHGFPLIRRLSIDLNSCLDGSLRSSLVQRLSLTHSLDTVPPFSILPSILQRSIFRQRAWVFLDDTRLCQKGLDHFPTIEELDKQQTTAYGVEYVPGVEEGQRLRLLQLYQYRREAGIKDTQNERQEYIFRENDEASIPRFFDQTGNRDVTTFWRHIRN
ncbi:hypothetical protein ACJA88_012944 [Fusarium oxysporum]|uniref:Uncharacterized protein n=1 Tax=Fusarium oxysporum Fo47 TaxID=660027 RepID=W9JJN6_FUSOX|nr:hypothetical protein FOZG_13806 [Fusarium oxysporum Fo47]